MLPAPPLSLLAVLAQQPPAEPPPFIKEFSRVGTYYYQNPDPQLGPKMLKELIRKENLEHPFFVRNDLVPILIGAQIGDIGTGHPEVVREYEGLFADASPNGRKVILRALTNAGDKETAKKVGEWAQDPKFTDQKTDLEALKAHIEDP